MENKRADAGRDGSTRLARLNFQARRGTDKEVFIFPCSVGHEQDWQPYPVDPYSALCVITYCGKREAHINSPMVTPEKAAPVTGTTLRTFGPVPADSLHRTPSVCNCVIL